MENCIIQESLGIEKNTKTKSAGKDT